MSNFRDMFCATAFRDERGTAMVLVVIIMVLVGGFTTVMLASSYESLSATQERTDKVTGIASIQSAINAYRHALQTGMANDNYDFLLSAAQLRQVTGSADSSGRVTVYDNAVTSERDALSAQVTNQLLTFPPGTPQVTVREEISSSPGDRRFGYWQLWRVIRPQYRDYTRTNVVVYYRAWQSNGTADATVSPRIIRAEFRPNLFSEFQILSDGPIRLENNAVINGPVHSNGYTDDLVRPPADGSPESQIRIWNAGNLTCVASGTNTRAMITTASGLIASGMPASCNNKASNTGRYVNFMRVDESVTKMRADCASGFTRCINASGGSADGEFTVQLNSGAGSTKTHVKILPPAGASQNVGTNWFWVNERDVLLFNRNINISGRSAGRLTIAAAHDPVNLPPGYGGKAANVRITGNLTRQPAVGNTLGVISQGNIIAETAGCPISQIHAALVAGSGRLTIPTQWTSQMYQRTPNTANARCTGALSITGSVASHQSPTLHWKWTPSMWVGYSNRSYTWDKNLLRNPPPYFPMTDQWQTVKVKDANADCIKPLKTASTVTAALQECE